MLLCPDVVAHAMQCGKWRLVDRGLCVEIVANFAGKVTFAVDAFHAHTRRATKFDPRDA